MPLVANQVIYTGDDTQFAITLCLDGAIYPLSALTDTVTAGVTDTSGTLLAGPYTCLDSDLGADWPNGIVSITLDGTDTATILTDAGKYLQEVQVEVQVTRSGLKRSWRHRDWYLVKDGLP